MDFFSNYAIFQQLTKLLSSLHTSLLMVGSWAKKPLCCKAKTSLRFKGKKNGLS